jgi:hypothetical protein
MAGLEPVRLAALVWLTLFACACGGAVVDPEPTATDLPPAAEEESPTPEVDAGATGLPPLLADRANRVLVVVYIATWSEPALVLLEHLGGIQQRFGEQDVSVVAVAGIQDDPARVEAVRRRRGMGFPVIYDDGFAQLGQLNAKHIVPFTLILDASGKVVWWHEAFSPGDEELIEEAVRKQLEAAPKPN